jgi:hypothetical protein
MSGLAGTLRPCHNNRGSVELRPAARLPIFFGYIAYEEYELAFYIPQYYKFGVCEKDTKMLLEAGCPLTVSVRESTHFSQLA